MRHHLVRLAKDKEHPLLQFIKYGMCGGLATAVDMAVFYLLALFLFPALGESDIVVRLLGSFARTANDAAQMERNFIINSCLAFVASNLTAYVLNAWLVFHSDKNSRHREMTMFFVVSGASIAIGIFLGWILVRATGVASWGYVMKVFSSLMINYVGRKFFVFNSKHPAKELGYEA